MSDRPDDMLSWLRSQILARKTAAEAASDGPWVNTGQDGDGDAWQIHGAPTEETTVEWPDDGEPFEVPVLARIATLNYDDGGGVWRREDADHIVLNHPQDTIARCETELALLADHSDFDFPANEDDGPGGYSWTARCDGCGQPTPCRTARLLASGYRHRPGWLPEWAPEEVGL